MCITLQSQHSILQKINKINRYLVNNLHNIFTDFRLTFDELNHVMKPLTIPEHVSKFDTNVKHVNSHSPYESPDSAIWQQEAGLVLPHGVQPDLQTDGGRHVADLLPAPGHRDLVPVPPRHSLAARQPHPEVEVASTNLATAGLHPPGYQEEEEVIIKADTLGSPPPVLLILTKIQWLYFSGN